MSAPTTPLGGLRVVELTTTPIAARVGQFLADMGADVIQVEPPGGSPVRAIPGYPAWGRGKRSIVLDLHDKADRAVAVDLAEGTDVLVETWRPGVAERLGLGYDALSAANPRLVHVSVTGWGREGPMAGVKGYEHLVMAKLGVLQTFAPMKLRPGPAYVSAPFCSAIASQHAIHGVLAALYERETSGVGQYVETNMVKSFAALDTWALATRLVTQRYPDAFIPTDAYVNGIPASPLAFMLLIPLTKDGHWLQFAQVQPRLFAAFMKAIDLAWTFEDPEWKGIPVFEDEDRRRRLWEMMLTKAHKRTFDEWCEVFEADHNVFAELFRSGTNVLDHPQLVATGRVTEVLDPELGPVRQLAPMVRFPGQEPSLRPAPRLDEHGAGLRAEVGTTATSAKGRKGNIPAGEPPLAGVTVLELGMLFAGPYGSTLLADLGADVIHIEHIDGDPIRNMTGFPEVGSLRVMQGKKSLAIDTTSDAGREIIHEIAKRADLVLHSFRPAAAERHGYDPATLRTLNPNVVYVHAPAYGLDGPFADRPAFAPSIAAGGGVALRNAAGGVPERPDLSFDEVKEVSHRLNAAGTSMNANADGIAAHGVATGLLVGLLAKKRGVEVSEVETTMLGSTAHSLSDDVIDYAGRPQLPQPDDDFYGLNARYRLYEASDGWVFLAAPEEDEWERFVGALSADADVVVSDARFATADDRHANDDALADVLAKVFRTRPAAEWERRLLAEDVGCVDAYTGYVEERWLSDFGREGGYVVDVEHATFETHQRPAPTKFSRSTTLARPGPLAGADTDEILGWLGYPADRIAELRASGVVA